MKMDFSFENTELRAGRWVTHEWESRVRFHSCAPSENLRAIQKGRGAVQGLMLAEPVLDPSYQPSSRLCTACIMAPSLRAALAPFLPSQAAAHVVRVLRPGPLTVPPFRLSATLLCTSLCQVTLLDRHD